MLSFSSGVDREIRDLYQRVTAQDAAPIVLLYGQSGVGKSSLLAAGLLPRLEAQQEVRYGRRDPAAGLLGTLRRLLTNEADGDVVEAWHRIEAAGRPLLVVLDQVEEAYTRNEGRGDRELAELFQALQPLCAAPGQRPKGRLLLSFRKEWSSDVRRLLSEERLAYSESSLTRLERAGIVEAVSGLERSERLRRHYSLTVAADLPRVIADDLLEDAGAAVAPTLQVLLTKMWERAKAQNFDHPHFDLPLYWEMKREGLLLRDFLDQQLRSLHEAQPAAVESGLALDMLAFHTTPQSTAAQWTQAELVQEYRHQEAVLPTLVREFQRRYLLVNPAQHQPDKPPSTRLAHDALAPLVRERFARSVAPGQQARRILENRAVDWEHDKVGAPLDPVDLKRVEIGIYGMRKLEPAEQRLLVASRSRLVQRRRNIVLGIPALVVLIIIAFASLRNASEPFLLRLDVRQEEAMQPVEGFLIDQFEVSIDQYKKCRSAGECGDPVPTDWYDNQTMQSLPITNIKAFDALSYCRWLGKRLPTMREWYTATRMVYGTDVILSDGSIATSPAINMRNAEQRLWPARSASEDEIKGQIVHLIGNAREWTMTEAASEIEAPWDGEDPNVRLYAVGGSYFSPIDYLSTPYPIYPGSQNAETGFRCVATPGS